MRTITILLFCLVCLPSVALSCSEYDKSPERLRTYLNYFFKKDAFRSYTLLEKKDVDGVIYQYGRLCFDDTTQDFYYSNDLREIYIYNYQKPAWDDPNLDEPKNMREFILNRAKEIGAVIQSQSGERLGDPEIEWYKYGTSGGSYWTIKWTRYSKDGIPYPVDGALVSFTGDGQLITLTQGFPTRKILNSTIKVPEDTAVDETKRLAEKILTGSYPVSSVKLDLEKIEPCIINCYFTANPKTGRRLSSKRHEGLIVFKHPYVLREKIPANNEGLTYAVSAVYVYVNVETGEIAAFDQLGW